MKIGARNQLKGRIVEVRPGATTTRGKTEIGGQTVTASITNEAAQALSLKSGMEEIAIINAPDVMIGVD